MHLAAATVVAILAAVAVAVPSSLPGPPVCRPSCAETHVCVPSKENPRVGVCVKPSGSCGGILGRGCEVPTERCIDDPHDDCDPAKGGSDCIGICVSR